MSEFDESTLASLVYESRPITYGIVQPGPDISPDGIPLIRGKDYSSGKVSTEGLYHVLPAIDQPYSRSKVLGGDLLFSIVGYVGLTAQVPPELSGANITQTTARLSIDPNKADSTYVFHFLSSPYYRPNITRYEKGSAQPGLNLSDVQKLKIKHPKPPQQRRIATILTTLDEVIAATEKLVEKHQQIKAGLMHDLFTRGLWTRPELARGDHHGFPCEATAQEGKLRPTPGEAPGLYQDSPLGLIPNSWKVTSIERLLDRIIDYRGKTPVKTESGVPLITAKNVRMGFIDPEPREFIAEAAYETWMTRGIPKYSDVLFTTEAPLGNVAQIGTTEKVAFAQRVIILQPASWVNPEFLKHLLISAKFQRSVFNLSSGTTALGVKQSEFRKVLVSHPSQTEEQESIANRINSMEDQEATQKLHLAKLRQQKQGLMHDLLTGRVRVDAEWAGEVGKARV